MYNFLVSHLHHLVLGFLSGVFFTSVTANFLESIWFLPLFLALVFGLWGISSSTRRVMALITSVFLFTFTLGLLLTSTAKHSHKIKLPATNSQGSISVTGIITAEPDERDRDVRLIFRPDESSGQLLLVLPIFSSYRYGDRLRVTGRWQLPQTFETEAGRIFDYPAYLALRGIGGVMYLPKIERLAGSGSIFIGQLFELKAAFLKRLDRVLPEPQASLLGGLIVGDKRSLGKVWQERFRRAGLIHLVVLSGYNLTIIGAAMVSLLTALRLQRSRTLIVAALAIILFAIMVGGGASVIRASIMALIVILARLTGRSYDAGRALVTAIIVMVIANPLILVNDIGFQLSCLATMGLIYGVPLVERWFYFIPTSFGFRSLMATTVSAQLTVLPWLLWATGQVSPYALISNVLTVPIVPLTMLLAAMIGFAGLLLLPLAFILAPLGALVATYILMVTKIVATLPGSAFVVGTFPFILVIIIYVGYFFIWRRSQIVQLPSVSVS